MADTPNKNTEQFTGLSKYFNNETIRGRSNVAKVVMGTLAVVTAYLLLKPKKEKKQDK